MLINLLLLTYFITVIAQNKEGKSCQSTWSFSGNTRNYAKNPNL